MAMATNYYEDVLDVVRQIPQGRVSTYGAIAAYLGLKSGARMVGWVLNQSLLHSEVPAHRVVNRQGLLTGRMHFSGPSVMQTLLESEGIQVVNHQVMNFQEKFWDPSVELSL
ncbi:MAG: MGMT family protein [Cyclobacteriaceae bacterium]|nr:MGMT family protein [Cyclobacteriaceae bacterium]